MPEEKNKKIKTFALGVLAGLIIAGVIAGIFRYTSKEQYLHRLLNKKAITEATDSSISEGKYKGMLEALDDPYAGYFTKEETKDNNEKTSGSYEGLGVVIYLDEDTGNIVINGVFDKSSAAEEGLQAGDIILKIGETDVREMATKDVLKVIEDIDGAIPMTIQRDEETFEVSLNRGKVEIPKVFHEMKEDHVGYIAIRGFTSLTASQFKTALDDLKEQGMEGLIIDLRGNPGGLVNAAVDSLNYILPEGEAVYTMNKEGRRKDYNVAGKTPLEVPLVLLVDGSSASAAEIFAGACRDRLQAKLVGTTTFGKGIVQTTYELADGSSAKFTTAHYYTPNGVDLNGSGLTPDIVSEIPETDGGIEAASDQDTQFKRALEEVKKEMADEKQPAA